TAPVPRIIAPASSTRFRVGDTIVLRGAADDAQDGALADDRLSWTVTLHHATHTHPYLASTAGNNVPIVFPAPEDLDATTNSFLRVQLTATDSAGLATSITQDLLPMLVTLTVSTDPSGLQFTINGSQ